MGLRDAKEVSLVFSGLAVVCRDLFQNWYRKLGFTVSVPLPPISDKEFKRREDLGQALFYRPSTTEVSYEALMRAVGQGAHWTVTDKDERKIGWEPAQEGYWFWAEVAQNCPCLRTSWNTLTKEQKLNLLSVEEYVIVWWAHKADINTMLDMSKWSWLRTRFGLGALGAGGYDGGVRVRVWGVYDLACSYGGAGGRSAEVVKT